MGFSLERVMGLEPTISAWKANVLPLHYTRKYLPYIKLFGAGDGARTRHLRLGKAALYQMSYSRISHSTVVILTHQLCVVKHR